MSNIYRKEFLPPDGAEVMLEFQLKPAPEGKTILDVIENRIKKGQIKLLNLQKKIKEASQKNRNLEEDILFEAKEKAEKIITEAKESANQILNEAKESSNEILTKTNSEIDQVTQVAKQDGYEQGFKEGKEQGINAGQEVIKKTLSQIHNVLLEAKHKREEIIQTNQEMILDLALMIAKKIIKTELATNKQAILKNLTQTLKKVKNKEEIKVKINPVHLQELSSKKEELLSQVFGLEGINFEEDENIEPGGCLIETNFGLIDATISSQLEIIYEALRDKETRE
ncbi:MAG: FliH/SctL family protein [bacterium]